MLMEIMVSVFPFCLPFTDLKILLFIRSPFEETVESPHHEFTWPFHFLNDIYKQLTDQITSSTNWIKSRSSYTLMFGNGSNGRQIFLVRARPHLTVNPSLSHSNLAINPIHEQSKSISKAILLFKSTIY